MSKKLLIIIGIVASGVILAICLGIIGAIFVNKISSPEVKKANSKSQEIGIVLNAKILEGLAENIIGDYSADSKGVSNFETKIAQSINNLPNLNQKIRNPITGGTNIINNISKINKKTSFAYTSTDNGSNGAVINATWKSHLSNAKGVVAYAAYIDKNTNKLKIKIIPYDANGDIMTEYENVISQ